MSNNYEQEPNNLFNRGMQAYQDLIGFERDFLERIDDLTEEQKQKATKLFLQIRQNHDQLVREGYLDNNELFARILSKFKPVYDVQTIAFDDHTFSEIPKVFRDIDELRENLEQKMTDPGFDPRTYQITIKEKGQDVAKYVLPYLSEIKRISTMVINSIEKQSQSPRTKDGNIDLQKLEESAKQIEEYRQKYIVSLDLLLQKISQRIDELIERKAKDNLESFLLKSENISFRGYLRSITDLDQKSTDELNKIITELAQNSDTYRNQMGEGNNEAEKKAIDELLQRAKDLADEAQSFLNKLEKPITPEELKEFNLWQKFLFYYGRCGERGVDTGNEGKLLKNTKRGREIIRGIPSEEDSSVSLTRDEITKERHRAFARWYIQNWSNQIRTIFDPVDMQKVALPDVDHDITIVQLAGETDGGQGFHEGQQMTWGASKIISLGANIYPIPQDREKIFGIPKEVKFLSKDFNNLFQMGHWGSGALSGAEYLQMALQFINLHDPKNKDRYAYLLQGHLGDTALGYVGAKENAAGEVVTSDTIVDFKASDFPLLNVDPDAAAIRRLILASKGKTIIKQSRKVIGAQADKVNVEKGEFVEEQEKVLINGKQIYDILVADNTDVTDDDKLALVNRLILFILQQDRVRLFRSIPAGVNPNDPNFDIKMYNPISIGDAKFAAHLALNYSMAMQKIAAMDNVDYVSKMFTTRLMFLEWYRRLKINNKNLGSSITEGIFKRLLYKEGFEGFLISKNGVSVRDLWMLAGVIDDSGVGAINSKDLSQLREHFKLMAEGPKEQGWLDVQKITDLSFTREEGSVSNFEFLANLGETIDRVGGYANLFYDIIVGKKKIVENWVAENNNFATIRDIFNDKISYYFADITKSKGQVSIDLGTQSADDAEQNYLMGPELVVERKRFASYGYVLIRKSRSEKNGKLVCDYAYTPMFDFFQFIPRDRLRKIAKLNNTPLPDGADENSFLYDLSINDPVKLQKIIEKELSLKEGGNMFIRGQELLLKWMMIGEMSKQRDAFRKEDKKKKKGILTEIFSGLNASVHFSKYATFKSVWSKEQIHAPEFGKLSIKDIEDMLYKADWISSNPLMDRALKRHILMLKVKSKITSFAHFEDKAQ